ncbi:hypothetical protein K505DRAFT_397101 [Melanomma pulvis-pyrius CBS 109.77]|uniref:Uncharacterized protein n=1 Tax=Melanomma pulvis-pyrius CBS 109.77 TaxID=1314802 RepID=A0A6A6WTN8_9PLEO|nr:hypothetical protein K505DRAFT_397101 [Melanomma pulvis-pyrius CBS 109.77]
MEQGAYSWDAEEQLWFSFDPQQNQYRYFKTGVVVHPDSVRAYYKPPNTTSSQNSAATSGATANKRERRDSADSTHVGNGYTSGESYWSNQGLDSSDSDRRMQRSLVEATVQQAPPKPQKGISYPKKWRENPSMPTNNAPGRTLSYPVSNSGTWQPKTAPGSVRVWYPAQDKSLGPLGVIHHDAGLGSDMATNMRPSNYHSKTNGELGLGSNGYVKAARPKAKKMKWEEPSAEPWEDSTEPWEDPDEIKHWAEDEGAEQ